MKRILIIDDDLGLLLLLSDLLKREGYQVETSLTGAKGLDLFTKKPFDLVITDFFIPDLDGATIIQEVKGVNPAAKIMVISAQGETANCKILDFALKLGANQCLSKPLQPSALLASVGQLLST